MSRRVYIHKFIDVNGDYRQLEHEKELKLIEWQVMENKHNIDMLSKKRLGRYSMDGEESEKEYIPPMRDVIKKRG